MSAPSTSTGHVNSDRRQALEASLDGYSAIALPRPATEEETQRLVEAFLKGLRKLLSKDSNWAFWQPLQLSLDNCTRCQSCSEACHIYEAGGGQEPYRPSFRAELLRRIIRKYLTPGGKLRVKLTGTDIELTWTAIARLAELAYRCNLCRRCAQACPIGVDNGLIAHEIRKLFSMEMGIAPKEIHQQGTVNQLNSGSSTGMTPAALKDNVEFLEEEVQERTGMEFKWPVDVEGADILLLHNAGEYMAWPENPEAFAIILEKAGISYTLSSDLMGYDAVNYGLWYDDVQFARIALKHAQVAKKLGVRKIVIGECGHAHKALSVIADRIFGVEYNVPRESCLTLLDGIVAGGRLQLDPSRNDFPVTLHDPCNVVRLMGIVEPQRRILRKIAPRFREMTPHGVDNYCCGGGSGFAIMNGLNFPEWRNSISGRKKLQQILNAFHGELDRSIPKYVCAPCSNCKGQIRELLAFHGVDSGCSIKYGGLVELIVNAMPDIQRPFISWEG
ncbi:MAG TPA: (Fe-S)-binding protein [Chloroflexota bacterium]|nr:(Fe-S)-binding protein [Chloroflexota bacterium]